MKYLSGVVDTLFGIKHVLANEELLQVLRSLQQLLDKEHIVVSGERRHGKQEMFFMPQDVYRERWADKLVYLSDTHTRQGVRPTRKENWPGRAEELLKTAETCVSVSGDHESELARNSLLKFDKQPLVQYIAGKPYLVFEHLQLAEGKRLSLREDDEIEIMFSRGEKEVYRAAILRLDAGRLICTVPGNFSLTEDLPLVERGMIKKRYNKEVIAAQRRFLRNALTFHGDNTTGEYLPVMASLLDGNSESNTREKDRCGAVHVRNPDIANDESQMQLLSRALNGAAIELGWGPPGTGKTTASAEVCYQNWRMGKSQLVASQTNRAVDNVLLKLKEMGIKVYRVGNHPNEFDPGLREDWLYAAKPKKRWQGEIAAFHKQPVHETLAGENCFIFEDIKLFEDSPTLQENDMIEIKSRRGDQVYDAVVASMEGNKLVCVVPEGINPTIDLTFFEAGTIRVNETDSHYTGYEDNIYYPKLDEWRDSVAEEIKSGRAVVGGTCTGIAIDRFLNRQLPRWALADVDNEGRDIEVKDDDGDGISLPFKFERGIIEEGSVAPVSEALLVLERIREKVLIIGDHKQLGVSMLDTELEKELMVTYLLNIGKKVGTIGKESIFPDKIGKEGTFPDTKSFLKFVSRHHPDEYKAAQNKVRDMQTSLFEILLREGGFPITMLKYCYRMTPLLVKLINIFYDGKLIAAREGKVSPEENKHSLVVVDTKNIAASRDSQPDGRSSFNQFEGDTTMGIVRGLGRHAGIDADWLGLITPYRAQVTFYRRELRDMVKEEYQGREAGKRIRALMEHTGTVWPFQGTELPVIVVSSVRSNTEGRAGFVSWQMWNVMDSRGQECVINVMNTDTFIDSQKKGVRRFVRHMRRLAIKEGIYIELTPDEPEPDLSETYEVLRRSLPKRHTGDTPLFPEENTSDQSPFGLADGGAVAEFSVATGIKVRSDIPMSEEHRAWNIRHEEWHSVLNEKYPDVPSEVREVLATILAFQGMQEITDGHLKVILTGFGVAGTVIPDLRDEDFVRGVMNYFSDTRPGYRNALNGQEALIMRLLTRELSLDNTESRAEIVTDAITGGNAPTTDTSIILVALPKDTNQAEIQSILQELRRTISRKYGYQKPFNTPRAIRTFLYDPGNPLMEQEMKNEMEEAANDIRRIEHDESRKHAHITVFAPLSVVKATQTYANSLGLAKGQIDVIHNKYIDCKLNKVDPAKNQYSDLAARVAIGRQLTYYRNSEANNNKRGMDDAEAKIDGLLARVSEGRMTLKDLLLGGILRIMPLGNFFKWKEYHAIVISV